MQSTDHTSILVECTFAINSTAPGIVVIQDDQSQYTINKTLQRDSDKGSVNITGLPAGEYSVRVYDNMADQNDEDFAYEHSQILQIIVHTGPIHVASSTIGKPYSCMCLQNSLYLLHKIDFSTSFFSSSLVSNSVTPRLMSNIRYMHVVD